MIGVVRSEFFGTEVFFRPALWLPMAMQPQIEIGNPWLDNRATRNTLIAGRLPPGVTTTQAEADLSRIASALARDYPRENRELSFTLTTPGWLGSQMRTPMRAFMFGVLFLASLVLLVACANLASMMLARSDDRRRELAIRGAIGAGRWRLFRQLTTGMGHAGCLWWCAWLRCCDGVGRVAQHTAAVCVADSSRHSCRSESACVRGLHIGRGHCAVRAMPARQWSKVDPYLTLEDR